MDKCCCGAINAFKEENEISAGDAIQSQAEVPFQMLCSAAPLVSFITPIHIIPS